MKKTDHTANFGSAAKVCGDFFTGDIKGFTGFTRFHPSLLCEIMGRDAGWLSTSSCVLRANGVGATPCLSAGEYIYFRAVYSGCQNAMTRYKAVIIAVSEGVTFPDAGVRGTGEGCLWPYTKCTFGIGKKLEEYTAKAFSV